MKVVVASPVDLLRTVAHLDCDDIFARLPLGLRGALGQLEYNSYAKAGLSHLVRVVAVSSDCCDIIIQQCGCGWCGACDILRERGQHEKERRKENERGWAKESRRENERGWTKGSRRRERGREGKEPSRMGGCRSHSR